MVSTSVCGTFFSALIVYQCRKDLFTFSSFSYPGTQWYIVLVLVPGPPFVLRSQGCQFDSPFCLFLHPFFLFLVLRMRSGLRLRPAQGLFFLPHVWLDGSDYTYKFTFYYNIITTHVSCLYASDDHFRWCYRNYPLIDRRRRPLYFPNRPLMLLLSMWS